MKARALGGILAGAALGATLLVACGTEPVQVDPPEAPVMMEAAAPEPPAVPPLRSAEGHAHATPSRPVMADGLLPGMARFRSGPMQDSNPTCNNPQLSYFGGPLLQSPVIVAVFWTATVNATLQMQIGQFYADVTNSSYWPWLHEYDSVGLNPGTNQAILPGTFGGSFVIAPLICAPGGNNCKLTDAQVQAELARQIMMGVLPAPTLDCTGNVNTIYMVDFPPNISLGGPNGAGRSCVNNGFCAYHNTGTFGPMNLPLIYGAVMDTFTGPCAMGCGNNATALESSTDVHSHELTEAVTDPDVGLDLQNNYANPAAWGDNNNNCGEIADICDDGSPGDTITVSGRTWVVQQLWSNKQGKCTSTGTPPPICSGTTVTNCRPCSCGDNGLACNGATSVCEATSTNVLFGGCESCTATNSTCLGGGTCQQSATPSQDDICMGCTPTTTACPAGDTCGVVPDGCGGVVSCGTCTLPQTCGGGTPSNPNQCGCTPPSSCPNGDNCGTVPDGCGGTMSCGTCMPQLTCGGGNPGKPNHCGCTALKTCPTGFTCGAVPDGCGGVVTCGTCMPPQTCGGGTPGNPNQCGCAPMKTCPAGFTCGAVPDGCGGVVECGTCAPPQTCGGGTPGNPNQCGCTPVQGCPFGDACGAIPDGCGGNVQCGTCGPNQVCAGHQCIDEGSSSAATTGASSSSGGGGGGVVSATTSSGAGGGAGASYPLYGRAGCSYAAASSKSPDSSVAWLGLAGLACIGARRRRGTGNV